MSPDSPDNASIRSAHPLARALIAGARPQASLLEVGGGSGRNSRALRSAEFDVVTVEEPHGAASRGPFGGALSTHHFLHGTPASIAEGITSVAAQLEPGAPFFFTLGSVNDARFGRGRQIDESTYAPDDGDEAGVAHAFFDEAGARAVLGDELILESISEEVVDTIAGRWAHERTPLRDARHWFVRTRRR